MSRRKSPAKLNVNQKSQTSSFTIKNNITQLPDYTDKQKIVSKQGIRIVSTTSNNLFPQILTKIVKESSTLKSVINSIAQYVSYGEVVASDYFLDKITYDLNKYYGWAELSKRLCADRKTYGYAFIEEVRIGGEVFIYHLDASRVRFIEYIGDYPEKVAISKDWNDTKVFPYELDLYPNYTQLDKKKVRIIPIMDYESGSVDYPFPMWSGCFYDAQVESLIGQYNANQFENGVTLSSMLKFDFGDVTNDDDLKNKKHKLEQQIKGTSDGRSGKTLIVPITGDVETPEYIQYPMQKEGSFIELQKLVENNIVKACSWFRSLAGLESAGTLGNNQQLRNEWELAERQIRNEQDILMEALLKAFENTPYENEEYAFNNQSPMNVINDISSIITLLQNRETIGVNSIIHILTAMGMDVEEAEKIANDSE